MIVSDLITDNIRPRLNNISTKEISDNQILNIFVRAIDYTNAFVKISQPDSQKKSLTQPITGTVFQLNASDILEVIIVTIDDLELSPVSYALYNNNGTMRLRNTKSGTELVVYYLRKIPQVDNLSSAINENPVILTMLLNMVVAFIKSDLKMSDAQIELQLNSMLVNALGEGEIAKPPEK